MSNAKANIRILKAVENLITAYPHVRFGQALFILKILEIDGLGKVVDPFHTDDDDVVERIKSGTHSFYLE